MSSDRLEPLTDMLQGYIDRDEVVGTVMLVARHGKVVHFEAQGLRDRDAGEPMATDVIFRMASMTKPITSVALMMLWEEGHLQLRDPVSKWIPEYGEMRVSDGTNSGRTVALETPVTVQHLLTHTAGIANRYRGTNSEAALALWTPRPLTQEESVLRFTGLPLNFQPGEKWQYGTATDVVGVLVERISGLTLDEFFRERIFEPLGMTDTHTLEISPCGSRDQASGSVSGTLSSRTSGNRGRSCPLGASTGVVPLGRRSGSIPLRN